MGKRGRPTALDETARREICLLVQSGHSLANVARTIGCAPNTIRNAAARDEQVRRDFEAACRNSRRYRVTRILRKSGSPALVRCARDLDDSRRWEERAALAAQQAAEQEQRKREKRERKRLRRETRARTASPPAAAAPEVLNADPFVIPTAEHVRMIGDFLLSAKKLREEKPPF